MNYHLLVPQFVFVSGLLVSFRLIGSQQKTTLTLGRHRGAQVIAVCDTSDSEDDELVRQLLKGEIEREDFNDHQSIEEDVAVKVKKLSVSQRIKLSLVKNRDVAGRSGLSVSPRGSGRKSPRSQRNKSPREEKSPRTDVKKSPRAKRVKKSRFPDTIFTHSCGGLRTIAAVEGQAALCNKTPEMIFRMYNTDIETIEEIERRDAELVKLLRRYVDENNWEVKKRRFNGTRQWVITTDATTMTAKEFRQAFGEDDPIPGSQAIAVRTIHPAIDMGKAESEYDIIVAMSEEVSQLDEKTFKSVFGSWRTEQEQFHFTATRQKQIKNVYSAIIDLCSEESVRQTVQASPKTTKAVMRFVDWYARKRRKKKHSYQHEISAMPNFQMLDALYDDEEVTILPSVQNSSNSSEDIIIESLEPEVSLHIDHSTALETPSHELPLSKRRTVYLEDPEESSYFPDEIVDTFADELQRSLVGYAKKSLVDSDGESAGDDSSRDDDMQESSNQQWEDLVFGESEDSEKEVQILIELDKVLAKRCMEVRRRTMHYDALVNEETGEDLYVFGITEESEVPVYRGRREIALSGIFSKKIYKDIAEDEFINLSEFISVDEDDEDRTAFEGVAQVLPELAELSPEQFAQEYAECELQKKEEEIEKVSGRVYQLLRRVREYEESQQESTFGDIYDESEGVLVLDIIDRTFRGKIAQFHERLKAKVRRGAS